MLVNMDFELAANKDEDVMKMEGRSGWELVIELH